MIIILLCLKCLNKNKLLIKIKSNNHNRNNHNMILFKKISILKINSKSKLKKFHN